MTIPSALANQKVTGKIKKFDVFVRDTKIDCRHLVAEGRSQDEALRTLKLAEGEVIVAVNERPE
jgi:hypothetical protein